MAKKTLPGHRGDNRDYKGEYERYHGKPEQIAKRQSRNKAHAKKDPPSGKHVHHKNGNPLDNSDDNLEVVSAEENLEKGDTSPERLKKLRKRAASRAIRKS
tara:strand:+ start:1352 stop:1654 length:303 start_codon:yes stop_codon:yes gene_type:complete